MNTRTHLSLITLMVSLAAGPAGLHAATPGHRSTNSAPSANVASAGDTNANLMAAAPLVLTNAASAKPVQDSHGFTLNIGDGDDDKRPASSHPPTPWWSDVLDNMVPLLGIVASFGTPVLIIFLFAYFRLRRRQMTLALIRDYLDKGVPVPPELLSGGGLGADRSLNLQSPIDQGRRDLRRGVILLFVGLAISIALYIDNPHHDWGWGLVPAVIGLGYIAIGVIEKRSDRPEPPRVP